MASTPEDKVKAKAKDLIRKYGALYDRTVMNGMGTNGRPDDLVCRADGHFAGVEYKRGSVRKVTALQRNWLMKIEERRGSSLVINLDNLSLLERWLSKPGWRVNAQFGTTEESKYTCVGHVAHRDGFEPVFIPFGKPNPVRVPQRVGARC